MRARAPGKLVLSGAYAVLEGAPAIVVAVDRYVIADSGQPAEFATPEVAAALAAGQAAPSFDASALRDGDRKLGLGSSAAIVVASLAALELQREPSLSPAELAARVFPRALRAHRAAQGGGSGTDVAASAFGGVLVARMQGQALALTPSALPAGFSVRVLAAPNAAHTPSLIRSVRALAASEPERYRELMGRQARASERAARAVLHGDGQELVNALRDQGATLAALGRAAGVSIVTPEMEELQREADARSAAALPAGAGGGDVALWVSEGDTQPPRIEALEPLALALGAAGVSRVDSDVFTPSA